MNLEHYSITPKLSEIKWKEEVSDQLLQKQIALKKHLINQFQERIQEIRIGFKTLGICWNSNFSLEEVQNCIRHIEQLQAFPALSEKVWKIPVCYDGEYSRDLFALAKSKNLTAQELIHLHSSNPYRLHFYGFLPGFMYLQGLHNKLHSPRKSIPEMEVPAGSVAIGGSQTGIYPSSSPGGWYIIGQTPIKFFDPHKVPPVWAEPGDKVQFMPITEEEFLRLKKNPESYFEDE
ncbi:5-oxoprolinase subunit PxpB [Algoriphagus sp.]|uniref:5-oxoprolinase subunit PxpB n=1 Tax=Algoriphagus sp. TaxID=1872435 RepID=UPI0025DCFF25|nr:5-oxoprolinase subunit PxpB [Algoriphagus sp.]